MAEDLSRRHVVRGAAVGVTALWAAPVIRSVRVGQATGSQPTATSTVPATVPARTIVISGTVNEVTETAVPDATCVPVPPFDEAFARHDVIAADITGLGPAVIESTACYVRVADPFPTVKGYSVRGDSTFTLPGGTVAGSITGEALITPGAGLPGTNPPRFIWQHRVAFTTGTGDYSGATGNATIWVEVDPAGHLVTTFGFSGQIDVPAH